MFMGSRFSLVDNVDTPSVIIGDLIVRHIIRERRYIKPRWWPCEFEIGDDLSLQIIDAYVMHCQLCLNRDFLKWPINSLHGKHDEYARQLIYLLSEDDNLAAVQVEFDGIKRASKIWIIDHKDDKLTVMVDATNIQVERRQTCLE